MEPDAKQNLSWGLDRTPGSLGWVPKGLRAGLRDRVAPWLAKLLNRVPSIGAKHYPLEPFAPAYILPKLEPGPAASDGMPVPPRQLWHEYADTADRFLKIGRDNVEMMSRLLGEAGAPLGPGQSVLDFGCGAGPMIRCLRPLAEAGEVWGVDLSAEHVWWCRRALGAPFRFAVTSTTPHLPFRDGTFDLVYCGSVFSHIPEQPDTWLCELARVIRPGGTLYATYVPIEGMRRYLERRPDLHFSERLRARFDAATLGSEFDMLVCERSPSAHVVYDAAVFRAMCESVFDVLSETPNAYSAQSALVLRRR